MHLWKLVEQFRQQVIYQRKRHLEATFDILLGLAHGVSLCK